MLRLYVFRHGETEWAASGQHTGKTDLPLTERGEAKARELRERLDGIRFSQVLTSPRLRARRTCELAGLSDGAQVEANLEEWDYGDYEGLRSAEIVAGRPGWNLFRDGCPGGEMPAEVEARADLVISRVRELDGNVALFSHGQFGAVLAARWIELPVFHAQHFPLETAAVSVLGYALHHAEVPVIALWNVGTDLEPS